MESTTIFNFKPLHFSLNPHPFFSKPISSISLLPPSKTNLFLKASLKNHHIPKQLPLLKTTCMTIATAALFFSSFTKPSIATPIPQPIPEQETVPEDEQEKILEQRLSTNPEDVDTLRSLMEIKLKNQNLLEAISIVDKLVQIEPLEKQWCLLRAHLYSYSGEVELAKMSFEEILEDDPLFVEAYHGLTMTVSQGESGELEILVKRIENAMGQCKKQKRNEDLRDFKLLVGQIRFIEGNYVDALKVYQELVKEEPRDFRPYLYQGIIYTLLRQTDNAKKQFEKYQRLVPKDHPYARQFEDNIMGSQAFREMMGNQNASSMS
ncbi:hypothetical protein IFM89_008460 [Coptis chinensis]|uniref:Chloroplast lumen common family protein n=1 Tax=Coptis chinensis TaxID=261450 RepID=A0A835H3Z1_9MAGN|nr:hypothetical protein IFM89_008460 [Coptis chinensis]